MSEVDRVAQLVDTSAFVSFEDGPSLEDCRAEWITGHHVKLLGQLRQARAAAAVKAHYGTGAIEEFARHPDIDAAPSTVYAYARAWRRLMEAFGEEAEIYDRLESSPLKITKVINATHESIEDIPKALDEAEDENLTTRQQTAKRRVRGEPQNVEVVTHMVCPECGALSPMSAVETREVPA